MTHMPPMSPNMHAQWSTEINKLDHMFRRMDSLRIQSGNYKYPPTLINEMKRIRNLLEATIFAHEEDAA